MAEKAIAILRDPAKNAMALEVALLVLHLSVLGTLGTAVKVEETSGIVHMRNMGMSSRKNLLIAGRVHCHASKLGTCTFLLNTRCLL